MNTHKKYWAYIKNPFHNHCFSNSFFSWSKQERKWQLIPFRVTYFSATEQREREGERWDQSQNNFMGWVEGKGRRAGFLKAFECVIYIPIHTIFPSTYLSPFLLKKTQNFAFPLPTLSHPWSNGTQTLPSSRYMTKDFVLNSRGQKHLLENVREG